MEREVAPLWRKASYSGSNGGSCVEVGSADRKILVRDSTNRAAGHIDVTTEAWTAFLSKIK